MSNTRKQTIIIAVLVVLIGCAGWFAKRFNDTAMEKNALSSGITEQTTKNFFVESKLNRDTQRSSMKQELDGIINNKEATKKSKDKAAAQLMKVLDRGEKENKIETMVKSRGYEDVLCVINENSIEICVKSKSALTADQVNELKNITVKSTGMSPSNIFVRQKQ